MKKFLGNFSPAYGVLTGEGEMGRMAKKGMMGLLPRMIAKNASSEEEEKKKGTATPATTSAPTTMKKGGSVSASKRADGCAKKGKTKGRMV
jgi:hypothetical protein